MKESIRQKQVASVIQQEMNSIFIRLNLTIFQGGMLSISSVKVTPDLLEARIYISLFKIEDKKAAMDKIEERSHEIKRQLSDKMKSQLRRIPVIAYYLDDTLDYVFKMEELFNTIGEKPETPES